jgi:hypothetical protein
MPRSVNKSRSITSTFEVLKNAEKCKNLLHPSIIIWTTFITVKKQIYIYAGCLTVYTLSSSKDFFGGKVRHREVIELQLTVVRCGLLETGSRRKKSSIGA